MEFPDFITGPQFGEGDIVTFTFKDAELTLRLPTIPYNDDTIDRVCAERDFTKVDTSYWEKCADIRSMELVVQSWDYMDKITHDDVANCFMDIHVIKHYDIEDDDLSFLNSKSFRNRFLQGIKREYESEKPETRSGWPSIDNDFCAKIIKKPLLDGLQVQFDLRGGGASYPTPVAYFPLGKDLHLRVTFEFGSLHYSNRKNPYSDDMLHQLKHKLFDEFLSFIQIEYTPETIAIIEQLKITKR